LGNNDQGYLAIGRWVGNRQATLSIRWWARISFETIARQVVRHLGVVWGHLKLLVKSWEANVAGRVDRSGVSYESIERKIYAVASFG